MNNINWSNRLNVLYGIFSGQSKNCPWCNSLKTRYFGRNAILSHVRVCDDCHLIFRWPKQNNNFNLDFYQKKYSVFHSSAVTNLPTIELINEYKKNNFVNSPRDFNIYVELVKKLGVTNILDYGCSWGYGAYQFYQSGINAVGFEISKPRAAFGREHLGVTIYDSEPDILGSQKKFDCIFSSHVLEHLPTPKIAFDFFHKVSKPSTIWIIEVPNCGGFNANALGLNWGPFSSSIHPLSYTSDFFVNYFSTFAGNLHLTSKPFKPSQVADSFKMSPSNYSLDGDDLICIKQFV